MLKAKKPYWLILLLVSLCISLLGLLLWFFLGKNHPAPNEKLAQSTLPSSVNTSQSASTAQFRLPSHSLSSQTILPPLPKSLQGTQVDGDIIIDENRQLVVTQGLRRLFDYFLSAQGEEPLETINQRIIDYINSHTPQPAASQAVTIYQQYLRYLEGVAKLEKNRSPAELTNVKAGKLDLELITRQIQAVKTLRQTIFDDKTIQAFFGTEDALNDYTLQVVRTNQNPSLSADEKQRSNDLARQTYINSFSDPAIRQKIEQQENINALLTETERLKTQGATEQQLNAMRRKYVDEATVQRLQALDTADKAFEEKVAQFNQQKAQLLANATPNNATQINQQILQLQESMFTPSEQQRLMAFQSLSSTKR